MSRAIPSSFNEYLLDNTSINTGIICDGGIMPVRNNPDITSTWYKKCLRGEDIMFLQEAICARRRETNYGLSDTEIKPNRLTNIQTKIGYSMSTNLWTDEDPTSSIGRHNFGSTYPDNNTILSWVQGKLHSISQSSRYDSYQILDSTPMEHLFSDIGKLNYEILFDPNITGGGYGGFSLAYGGTLTTEQTKGHYDGTTTHSTSTSSIGYVWYDGDNESYINNGYYPNGLNVISTSTISNEYATITENASRDFHRYFAIKPFFVVDVQNYYNASWNNQGSSTTSTYSYDNHDYIISPAPVNAYVDLLNPTTITYNTTSSWNSFLSLVFDQTSLKRHCVDFPGQYDPTVYRHSRQRMSRVSISRTLYIIHFLYCNLESVV